MDPLELCEMRVAMANDSPPGYPYVVDFVTASGNVESARVASLPRVRELIDELRPHAVSICCDRDEEREFLATALVGDWMLN